MSHESHACTGLSELHVPSWQCPLASARFNASLAKQNLALVLYNTTHNLHARFASSTASAASPAIVVLSIDGDWDNAASSNDSPCCHCTVAFGHLLCHALWVLPIISLITTQQVTPADWELGCKGSFRPSSMIACMQYSMEQARQTWLVKSCRTILGFK